MLKSIATELGSLLEGDQYYMPSDRRKRILEFIQLHMDKFITLKDLSAELKLSPSRLGHVIKDLFSITFPQLLRSVKITHAAHLLLSTDLNHSQIASRIGIQDSNYFSYQFNKEMGLSPRDYKKKLREEI